jgi:hypothetical protein
MRANDTTAELQQFDFVLATFRPTRHDDLQPGAAEWIGERCKWQAAWIIESGPYTGQWAMSVDPHRTVPRATSFAWAPFCDLADVEVVE